MRLFVEVACMGYGLSRAEQVTSRSLFPRRVRRTRLDAWACEESQPSDLKPALDDAEGSMDWPIPA